MTAYYNECDEEKAAWLRELILANVIAPGEVDERSITDVDSDDLRPFTQAHFFAGIGVWSYALRLAGWPDDRSVWTGSCPCPSFSCAGKGEGFNDPRHLWPAWSRLIAERKPATVFGEQADDAIGYGWLDLVQTDLERQTYSVGKAVLGACSVGAPHIRQRLYFCAYAEAAEVLARSCEVRAGAGKEISDRSGNGSGAVHSSNSEHARHHRSRRTATVTHSDEPQERIPDGDSPAGIGSYSNGGIASNRDLQRSREQRLLAEDSGTGEHSNSAQRGLPMHRSAPRNAGYASQPSEPSERVQSERERLERLSGDVRDWRGPGWLDPITARSIAEAGATRGFWGDCDWWHGKDGKFRPIERGLFPLVNGASNRVLKLRGYGDAIVPHVAAAFIEASEEAKRELVAC